MAHLRPFLGRLGARARAPLGFATRALSGSVRPPVKPMDSDPDFDDEPLEEHPAIMRRIDAVRFLHERHTALCDELAGKVEALQLEYDAKLAPILARRAEIVSGRSEPTPDEAKPLEHYLASFAPTTDEPEPGIPGFWLTAITEHEALRDAVTEADAPILEYLQDVQCIKFGPGERERARAPGGRAGRAGDAPDASDDVGELPGFELVFAFAPNPYFDERELRKVVWLEDGYPAATQGCAISWRAGKDVTHRAVAKHSKRQNRKVKALEAVPSFFHFFASRVFDFDDADFANAGGDGPSGGALSGGSGGDDGAGGARESQVEAHLEDLRMTLTFRDELVPNAAEWAAVIEEDGDE
ncbi:hypothetical protein KFE25_012313 [Diacronema lutheri]|uniref:Nucleosome assembly protein n=1 Tax=Diacronema lutheri TaxID=2081491 RepID=A0A8J5XT48_DIALT|nr:hypothetical protein KFE25_012313 [Diacronema lutheri]